MTSTENELAPGIPLSVFQVPPLHGFCLKFGDASFFLLISWLCHQKVKIGQLWVHLWLTLQRLSTQMSKLCEQIHKFHTWKTRGCRDTKPWETRNQKVSPEKSWFWLKIEQAQNRTFLAVSLCIKNRICDFAEVGHEALGSTHPFTRWEENTVRHDGDTSDVSLLSAVNLHWFEQFWISQKEGFLVQCIKLEARLNITGKNCTQIRCHHLG